MKNPLFVVSIAASLMALTAGCTTLSGPIKGEFSCVPAKGNCKPTSVIDAEARAQMVSALKAARQQAQDRQNNPKTIKVMLAAYTDAQGRYHEAKAIHVPVSMRAQDRFAVPPKTRAILKTLSERLKQIKTPRAPEPVTEPVPAESPRLPDGPSPDAASSGPEGSDLPPSHPDQTPPTSLQHHQKG